jgi:hypothetical protein
MMLGWSLVATGAYVEAEQHLQTCVAVWRRLEQRDELGQALGYLSLAALGRGNTIQGRQSAREALQMSLATRTVLSLSVSLLAAALVLVAEGEAEHALESYAVFLNVPVVPTHADWFRALGGDKLEAIAASLPPEVAAAARERGQARDPWAVASELVSDLEG